MKREKFTNEKGDIMIEATIVMVISIMVVFLILSLGMYVYHQSALSVIANEAAADIANTYGDRTKDPFLNYTDRDNLRGAEYYRHLLNASYDSEIEDKAQWYGAYRISKAEILKGESPWQLISVEMADSEFGRKQISVTVERKYTHLSEVPFAMFGLDMDYTVRCTGTAECYDMIDYIHRVDFKRELCGKADDIVVIDIIKTGMDAVKHIIDMIKQE